MLYLVALLISLGCAGCGASHPAAGSADPAMVARRYLEAPDRRSGFACLSDDFHMWFEERAGAGTSKAEMESGGAWDEALHSRSRIVDLRVSGDTVVVRAHEDNDFSLLLGYPGWDPTITYVVGRDGRIESALYVPNAAAPSWRAALERALPWLKANRAEALGRILPDGRLVRTRDSARGWVEALRAWRAATGQKDPTAHPGR